MSTTTTAAAATTATTAVVDRYAARAIAAAREWGPEQWGPEEWKPIAGTGGAYSVSSWARVRSEHRLVRGRSGECTRPVKARILASKRGNVSLGRTDHRVVSHLVAEAFGEVWAAIVCPHKHDRVRSTTTPGFTKEKTIAELLNPTDTEQRDITMPPLNRKGLAEAIIEEMTNGEGISVLPTFVTIGNGYDPETGADLITFGSYDEKSKHLLTQVMPLELAREAIQNAAEKIAAVDRLNAQKKTTNELKPTTTKTTKKLKPTTTKVTT